MFRFVFCKEIEFMKIIAVEDDSVLASAIEMMLEKLSHELIAIVDNSEEFLNIWSATQPDLALIDIKIEGKKNGIELAEIISNSERPIPIIFITSLKSQKTFDEAKKIFPFAFMPKPFDELALKRNIELALFKYKNHTWEEPSNLKKQKNNETPTHFFIKTGNSFKKIEAKDIYYISVEGKYSEVMMENGKHEVKMSLKELIEILPLQDFMRTHRNYIVNINYITEIALKQNYVMIEGTKIPVSQTYKEILAKKLNLLQ